LKALKKALVERALGAELTHHLGYAKGEDKPEGQGNHRNGTTPKTLITEDGELPIEVPRDRAGTFEPKLVPKGMRRLEGFDEKVLSLYARGMTVREIQGHLQELYGVEVSPDLISTVTDAVLDEVKEWQNRPLDPLYPVVIFDALRVKIRDEGSTGDLGRADGRREVLAEGDDGAQEPRCRRHPDLPDRRPEGLSGSDCGGVPADDGADVHRASAAALARLRDLEGPQGDRGRPQGRLSRADRRGRAPGAGGLCRRSLGQEVPGDCGQLEAQLGARHPVLRVPDAGSQSALHDQRDREPAHAAPEDREEPRSLPERRSRSEAVVSCFDEDRTEMAIPARRSNGKRRWRSSRYCSKIASQRSAADDEDQFINRLRTQKS
jgi:hypothetical protein